MNAPDTIRERLLLLLNGLELARRFASLYPDKHPRLQEALQALQETFSVLAADRGTLKLTLYKQECFLDEEPPEEEMEIPWGLSKRFLRLGISSVVFPCAVDSGELLSFLKLLGTDAKDLRGERKIEDLAKDHEITSISIVPLDYGRLFSQGLGQAAQAGQRDEEYFARLLTLWDPHRLQKEMSQEEVEALGLLSSDQSALARLVELSMKGPHPSHRGGVLVEGTVGAVQRLSERLRGLYPERWPEVRGLLVKAALSLDSDLLLRKRSDLLSRPSGSEDHDLTPAGEMDDDELSRILSKELSDREALGGRLAEVIRDLVPSSKRRRDLAPLIEGRLVEHGVSGERRREIGSWWKDEIVANSKRHEHGDPLFSALLNAAPQAMPREDPMMTSWFRGQLHGSSLDQHYFEDLRGFVGLAEQPEDINLALSSYQVEFKRLADAHEVATLRQVLEELAGELRRTGQDITETLTPLLGVSLIESLAEAAIVPVKEQRVLAREVARLFGDQGFRVIMEAISRTDEWELLEELRNEVSQYGAEALEEILQWLRHSDSRVAKEALILIRKFDVADIVSRIVPLQRHSDPEIRASALVTLVKRGGDEQMDAIKIGFMDASPLVVDLAVDAAEESGLGSYIAHLSMLLNSHRGDAAFMGPRGKAIRLAGKYGIMELAEELRQIIRGVGSWLRYTRDEALLVPAARALLQLGDSNDRSFVVRRARWGRGKVRKACRQVLQEEVRADE